MKRCAMVVLFISCVLLFLLSLPVHAQDVVTAPTNPAFLGYLNGNPAASTNQTTSLQQAFGGNCSVPQAFRPGGGMMSGNLLTPLSTGSGGAGLAEIANGLVPPPIDLSQMRAPAIANALGMESSGLPSWYDLRQHSKLTPIKDQGQCGSCWAFATYGSLESYLSPVETLDFSENNLKNTHGFSISCCNGGNHFMSTAYLSRWSGPLLESSDPYNVGNCTSLTGLLQKHVQDVTFIPDRTSPTDNTTLKQAVMKYGAVYTTFCWSDGYYSYANNAYYNPYDPGYGNHAVCIVGWDDNYSRYNFPTYAMPAGDGAFIVRNSWGTGWGQSGYFYVSYYDATFGRDNAAFQAETTTDFQQIYQYDDYGWVASMGFTGATPDTGWFANVFTARSNDALCAVSFYAYQPGSEYEIYIYLDPTSGPINPSGYAVQKTGIMPEAGYHTVYLGQSVPLTTGQRFSVVVKLRTPGYNYPIPYEPYWRGWTDNAQANPGESFVSQNGTTWTDLTSYATRSNVCLKAFAGSGDILKIDPITPAEFKGPVGGPFQPTTVTYTLTNPTDHTINWVAHRSYTWADLSASSGTLAPNQSTQVTISLGAEASSMGTGSHSNTIYFTDVPGTGLLATLGVLLTIQNGTLAVTPAGGLDTGGPVGGPFTPSSQTYTLTNRGYSSLHWTASANQNWISLSATEGDIAPGDFTTVIASINSNANGFAIGSYQGTISINNTTNGLGSVTRDVSLLVGRLYVSPSGNDSNDGLSWATAKKSIHGAMGIAHTGQEVWVAAGEYDDFWMMEFLTGAKVYGGFAGNETSLSQRNWRANVTHFDAPWDLFPAVWIHDNVTGAVLDGFTIDRSWMGVYCGYGSDATICNNTIRFSEGYFGYGIFCYDASARIINNVITGGGAADTEQRGGIRVSVTSQSSPYSQTIINNTIVGNHSGIWCSKYSSPRIINNIVALNQYGIRKDAESTPVLLNNDVWGNEFYNYKDGSGNAWNPTGSNGNISADPKIANLGFGDLHIQPSSPCVDAGKNDEALRPDYDIDMQPRPGAVDIGADESDGTTWPAGPPAVIRVSPDGNDSNDGLSWATAKATVQAGIDAAATLGGEVWVAAGIYNQRITLKPYVYVYGGFDTGDQQKSDRNPTANPTILDGQHGGSTVYAERIGYRTACIDGFTIRNGSGTKLGDKDWYGGDVFAWVCSPYITNNTITGGAANIGGGIHCYNSGSPLIAGNRIYGNSTQGDAQQGGGMCLWNTSPQVLNNTVENNTSISWGGGMAIQNAFSQVSGNRFADNRVSDAAWGEGAGVLSYNAVLDFSSNVVSGNSATTRGGGACFYGGDGTTITNNLFTRNSAPAAGGGLIALSADGLVVTNNTFLTNYSASGGAVMLDCRYSHSASVANNIIAYNSSGLNRALTYSLTLKKNCFFENCDYDCGWELYGERQENIWTDPKIANLSFNNAHIQPGSSCIDAGWPQAPGIGATDIEGLPRVQDGNSDGTAIVDVGAYESNGGTYPTEPPSIVYVSPTGNNGWDGSSWTTAKATIQAGIDTALARGGGEVWVAAGTYNELIILRPNVFVYGGFDTQDQQKSDRNWSTNVTTINGGGTGTVITANSIPYCAAGLDGFTITGGAATQGGGIACSSASPIFVNDMIVGNAAEIAGGGVFCANSQPRFMNNVIAGNTAPAGAGIYLSSSTGMFVNNTLSDNTGSVSGGGIYCQASSPKLYNNIVAFGSSGLFQDANSKAVIQANDVYQNNSKDHEGFTNTWPDISGDPKFQDRPSGDYRLTGTSACIDTGQEAAAPALDKAGLSRPFDGDADGTAKYDIGAYEYHSDFLVAKSSVALADLNGDGLDEAVFGTSDHKVHAVKADGTELAGWPVTVGASVMKAASIGDVDNDTSPEVVVGAGSALYAFEATGATMSGWPQAGVAIDEPITAPALADIDSDGYLECVLGAYGTLDVVDHNGTRINWQQFGDGVIGIPTIGDINGDGKPEIFCGTDCQFFVAYKGDGSTLFTFYDEVGGLLSSPVMADIDADQKPEVIACTSNGGQGHVFALNENGTYAAGWPKTVSADINSSPAVGDINGDGAPEIVVVANDGKVYSFTGAGAMSQIYDLGSPRVGYLDLEISPLLADVNADGNLDIILGWYDGKIHAFAADGVPLPGWPKTLEGVVNSTPAIGNMDNNSAWDVVVGYMGGGIGRWEIAGNTSSKPYAKFPWTTFHGTNERTGLYALITEPTVVSVTPAHGKPGTTAHLSATLRKASDQSPIEGKNVSFKIDGDNVGTGTTNALGIATVDYAIPAEAASGNYTIEATFAGSDQYRASGATGTLYVSKVIYVKWDSAGPTFDGTSWTTAFHSVQAAIDSAVAGDEVWVAGATRAAREIDPNAGLYTEHIVMKDAVTLLGGFDGTGTTRYPEEVLSIIDGSSTGTVVTIASCPSTDTIMDGFTIQHGTAQSAVDYHGGGIRIVDSSPTIRSCAIKNNTAWSGGGIFSQNSSPTIVDNRITANSAPTCEHYEGYGAGIYCQGGSPVIRLNDIMDGYANMGVGIYCAGSNAAITENQIQNNSAMCEGNCEGGGIYCTGGTVSITRNTIQGNSAWWGAGISTCFGSIDIVNNLITKNSSECNAGGLYCFQFSGTVVNNTIAENTALGLYLIPADGGGVQFVGGTPVVTNNIVAYNTSGIRADSACVPTLKNNDVFGNTDYNYSGLIPGTDDISVRPQFVCRRLGDYGLLSTSPCIEAGSSDGAPSVDRAGESRPIDGDCDGVAKYDIGAYEYRPTFPIVRRNAADGTAIEIRSVGVIGVFPQGSGTKQVYVEDCDKRWGVRVDTDQNLTVGQKVDVSGILRTDAGTGERYIEANAGQPVVTGSLAISAIGMRNKWIGGVGGGLIPPLKDAFGFYNSGMLVQTWGKVLSGNQSEGYFFINDGSNLKEGPDVTGLRVIVPQGVTIPTKGNFVKVTGVSSSILVGTNYVRVVKVRSQSDIQTVTTWQRGVVQLTMGIWNAGSLPGIPRDPDPEHVFVGTSTGMQIDGYLRRFDAVTQQWIYYDVCNLSSHGMCLLGDGYTMYVPAGYANQFDFDRTPATGDQLLDLSVGTGSGSHSFVGNPFDANVAWTDCRITDGTDTLSLPDAISAGWISQVCYWGNGDWQPIADLSIGNMEARNGYAFYTSMGGLALIVPEP